MKKINLNLRGLVKMSRNFKYFSVIIIIALIGVLFSSLIVCAAPKWELKHATYATAEHPYTKIAQGFADRIFKATNGEVKITVYPNAALCSGSDQFTSTVMGVADVTDLLSDYLVGKIDMIGLPSLPMAFDASKSGIVGEEAREILTNRLLQENLVYLYTYDYLPNVLFLKDKKESLADMKGLKVRASGIFPIEMLQAVGMVPVKMSTSDIYMAVETKLIEGAATGVLSWRSNKLNEILPYIRRTPVPCVGFVVMNKDVYNSMPKSVQDVIIDEAKKYSVIANKLIHEAEEDVLKKAVEEWGCTILQWSDADIQTLKEAGIKIRDEYLNKSDKDALEFWEALKKYPFEF